MVDVLYPRVILHSGPSETGDNMAARDRWESDYSCPTCGATGTVNWSRQADSVDGPLAVRNPRPFEHQVWCTNCDTRVDKREPG